MADQFPQAGSKSPDVGGEPDARGPGRGATHGATATAVVTSRGTHERSRTLAGALLGALGVTVVSAVFVVCFIGGLHDPGPRSVPIGLVGSPAAASRAGTALAHQVPGAFTVTIYPTAAAARSAIAGRSIDAALVPGPAVQHLIVATAVSQGETNAIIKVFSAGAAKAHVPLLQRSHRQSTKVPGGPPVKSWPARSRAC